jgi:flagellum-specific peptidoglycan hydrolase FlgJ
VQTEDPLAFPTLSFLGTLFAALASLFPAQNPIATQSVAPASIAAPAHPTLAAQPVNVNAPQLARPALAPVAQTADAAPSAAVPVEAPSVAPAPPSAPDLETIAVSLPAPRNAQETFIFKVVPGAQQSQRATGVPTSVTIAQAILESEWGRSYLAREANNLFGVKALTKPGPAGVVTIDAWEVENGVNVTRKGEPFRKYNSVAESIADHGMFFIENRRYREALLAKDDPKEFARRIAAAGYATDPGYAPKLIGLMDRYDLYRWDVA